MTTTELIQNYYNAFNSKNWEAMLECLSETIKHDVNEGEQRGGRERFSAFLQHMDACYDEQLTDMVVMTSPDNQRAAAEFIVNGIYKQTDGNLPPANNQKYKLPAGAFFEIRDGLIERVTTYYNLKEWIRQVSNPLSN